MTITKKDYIEFARIIKREIKNWDESEVIGSNSIRALERITNDLTYYFEQDNPLFEKDKFLEACEVKK